MASKILPFNRYCLWMVFFCGALTHPADAQDSLPSKRSDEAKVDQGFENAIDTFLTLPVHFNGRVTKISHVAEIYLERISGNSPVEENNAKTPGSVSKKTWFLDAICNHPRIWDCQLIPVPTELIPLIKIDNRSSRRFSMNEIEPFIPAIEAARQTTKKNPLIQLRNKVQAIDDLFFRIGQLRSLTDFHLLDSNIQLLAERAIAASGQPIPMLAPPDVNHPKSRGQWKPFLLAYFEDTVQQTHRPDLKLLAQILDAHRNNNRKIFQASVNAYAKSLTNRHFYHPLSYQVPAKWTELGNAFDQPLIFLGDARGYGSPIASFASRENPLVTGGLTCVRLSPSTIQQRANHDRFAAGRLPLDSKNITANIKRIRLGEWEASHYEVTDHPTRPHVNHSMRIQFSTGNLAWTISWYGPKKIVESERQSFMEFAKSLTVQPGFFEGLLKTKKREETPKGFFDVVYISVTDTQTIMLHLMTTESYRAEREDELRAAISSLKTPVQMSQGNISDRLEWKTPKSWTSFSSDGINLGDKHSFLTIHVFDGQANEPTQSELVDIIRFGNYPQMIVEKKIVIQLGERTVYRWALRAPQFRTNNTP